VQDHSRAVDEGESFEGIEQLVPSRGAFRDGRGVDLTRERAKAIEGLEKRARAHYDKGEDEQAAEAYVAAAHLLERHAAAAPSRRIEQARKAKAVKYLEYAKALRSGDIPKPEASASVSFGRASAKGTRLRSAIATSRAILSLWVCP